MEYAQKDLMLRILHRRFVEWSPQFMQLFVVENKFFLEIASINKEITQPFMRFSSTVSLSWRPFLTNRIFILCDFVMSTLKQPANIKFCVLLEKSSPEMLEMLKKACANDAIKRKAVYEFHKRFREGRTNIEFDMGLAFDKSRRKVMLELFFDY